MASACARSGSTCRSIASENGIDPNNIPAIAPGASADWTWYSATDRSGQFCATIGLIYQGWTYTASFDRTGKLLGSKIFPPK